MLPPCERESSMDDNKSNMPASVFEKGVQKIE